MALPALSRYRGDTSPITRTLGVDLTGATAVLMSLSNQRTGGTILGPINGTPVTAATGVVDFDISTLNLAVGVYFWDVQVTNASGVTTVEVGRLTIDQDLTV